MKKRAKESKHVRIYHYMSKTPAWKSLNGNERATYLLLAERYMGSNNGKIPFSVREVAAELDLSLSTAKQCLDRLRARGFIVVMKKGAFSMKRRHATEWRLTEHVCHVSGHGPTGEYRDWRPTPEIQNTVTVAEADSSPRVTDVTKISRDGYRSRTINGQKSDPKFAQSNTLSYQVPPSEGRPSLMQQYAARGDRRYVLSDDPRALQPYQAQSLSSGWPNYPRPHIRAEQGD
jgi:hypothetical protein